MWPETQTIIFHAAEAFFIIIIIVIVVLSKLLNEHKKRNSANKSLFLLGPLNFSFPSAAVCSFAGCTILTGGLFGFVYSLKSSGGL